MLGDSHGSWEQCCRRERDSKFLSLANWRAPVPCYKRRVLSLEEDGRDGASPLLLRVRPTPLGGGAGKLQPRASRKPSAGMESFSLQSQEQLEGSDGAESTHRGSCCRSSQ